jgi:hypothetical protein
MLNASISGRFGPTAVRQRWRRAGVRLAVFTLIRPMRFSNHEFVNPLSTRASWFGQVRIVDYNGNLLRLLDYARGIVRIAKSITGMHPDAVT